MTCASFGDRNDAVWEKEGTTRTLFLLKISFDGKQLCLLLSPSHHVHLPSQICPSDCIVLLHFNSHVFATHFIYHHSEVHVE